MNNINKNHLESFSIPPKLSEQFNVKFHWRNLPHWQPAAAIIFVTFRLFGALPKEAIERITEEKKMLEKEPLRPRETPRERALRMGKRLFGLFDKAMDSELEDSNSKTNKWL